MRRSAGHGHVVILPGPPLTKACQPLSFATFDVVLKKVKVKYENFLAASKLIQWVDKQSLDRKENFCKKVFEIFYMKLPL